MNSKKCTLLICSCDSYEDCWRPFFTLLRVYWPDCPYNIVLNTESKSFCIDALNISCYQFYQLGEKVAYGKRLLRHLKEIETPNVLLMMDDFFVRRKVSTEKIQWCVNELEKNPDIAVFSFDSVKDELNIDDDIYDYFMLRPKNGEYKLNFQGGVWKKSVLVNLVRAHESPWEIETRGSIRSFDSNLRFYTLKDLSLTPIDYGKKKGLTWGIVRGKWVQEDVVPLFQQHNIVVDFEQRGFFDRNSFDDITAVQKNNMWRDMQSYGCWLWFRMKCWRLVHIIQKLFHLPYDVDYVAYRRKVERNKRGLF